MLRNPFVLFCQVDILACPHKLRRFPRIHEPFINFWLPSLWCRDLITSTRLNMFSLNY